MQGQQPPADRRRIATIDVGTNTAELLVAELEEGAIQTVHEDERFVRLGEGVDARGTVSEAALERLKSALLALRDAAQAHGAEQILVGATSASRDAANQQAIVDFVQAETGLAYDILSGEEEATWTFRAACLSAPAHAASCTVLDIGGGSTEVIVGAADGRGAEAIAFRHSFNIGTVRLTERFFEALPPSPRAIERAEAFIREQLGSVTVPASGARPVLGNSGTALVLALVTAGPEAAWDALAADQQILAAAQVRQWRARLLTSTTDEVRALHPTAMHGRADVFPMGVLILDVLLDHLGAEALRVSPYQLRHGLLLRALRRQSATEE